MREYIYVHTEGSYAVVICVLCVQGYKTLYGVDFWGGDAGGSIHGQVGILISWKFNFPLNALVCLLVCWLVIIS